MLIFSHRVLTWRVRGCVFFSIPRSSAPSDRPLSRRERQIVDALYAIGEASVADVQAALPDAPGYSTVRTLLRILVEKSVLRYREHEGRYLYTPVQPRAVASRSAVRRLVETFFEGSVAKAAAALVDSADGKLSAAEVAELEALIRKARQK